MQKENLVARNDTHNPADPDVVVTETGKGKFQQSVQMGAHHLLADEPIEVGGDDGGPSPYDLLSAALGTCTAMTLRMYADRKKLQLGQVKVRVSHDRVHAADCENCETKDGKIDRFVRQIAIDGSLSSDQKARLMEIADMCPVHKTLNREVLIETVSKSTDD